MSRASMLAVSGALIFCLSQGPAWARKVSPIATRCPENTKRQIDWKENRDACLESTAPTCPADSLRVDHKTEEDLCVPAQTQGGAGDKAPKPVCPADHELHVQAGPDLCERSLVPECRKRFRLKILPGEDMCVY